MSPPLDATEFAQYQYQLGTGCGSNQAQFTRQGKTASLTYKSRWMGQDPIHCEYQGEYLSSSPHYGVLVIHRFRLNEEEEWTKSEAHFDCMALPVREKVKPGLHLEELESMGYSYWNWNFDMMLVFDDKDPEDEEILEALDLAGDWPSEIRYLDKLKMEKAWCQIEIEFPAGFTTRDFLHLHLDKEENSFTSYGKPTEETSYHFNIYPPMDTIPSAYQLSLSDSRYLLSSSNLELVPEDGKTKRLQLIAQLNPGAANLRVLVLDSGALDDQIKLFVYRKRGEAIKERVELELGTSREATVSLGPGNYEVMFHRLVDNRVKEIGKELIEMTGENKELKINSPPLHFS